MEILLAIHDKKLISNLEFQYLNEDELLYKSTAISIRKIRRYFPTPFYELKAKREFSNILKKSNKIQISFKIANEIDFFIEISLKLKIKEIMLSSYFLNIYYKERKFIWKTIYLHSFYKLIQMKNLKYDIGYIKKNNMQTIFSNLNNKNNFMTSFTSFIRKLGIQERLFEHFLIS